MPFAYAFKSSRPLRLLFVLLLLVGVTLLALYPLRPDFYQPARPSLTEAKRHLDSFYADERLLLQELSDTREQLNLTLDMLDKAEVQLTSQQRRTLEDLRGRIHLLDDLRVTQHLTAERLHEVYTQLAAELSALIASLH